jgi:Zn ribbon nucleic-acid-binding protein
MDEKNLIAKWEEVAKKHRGDTRAPVKVAFEQMKRSAIFIEVIGPDWKEDEVAETRFEMAAYLKKKAIIVADTKCDINKSLAKWRESGMDIVKVFKCDVVNGEVPPQVVEFIMEMMHASLHPNCKC